MRIDQVAEPKAIAYLRSLGHKVVQENVVNHDYVVDGKTVEAKYLGKVYPDIYCEIFQCFDVQSCPDCSPYTKSTNQVLYGWAHREGYCHADKFQIWHCKDFELVQVTTIPRQEFLDWLYDDYFKGRGFHNMITTYAGRHRTLGVPVPIKNIPKHLLHIHKVKR